MNKVEENCQKEISEFYQRMLSSMENKRLEYVAKNINYNEREFVNTIRVLKAYETITETEYERLRSYLKETVDKLWKEVENKISKRIYSDV